MRRDPCVPIKATTTTATPRGSGAFERDCYIVQNSSTLGCKGYNRVTVTVVNRYSHQPTPTMAESKLLHALQFPEGPNRYST
jgi:hypothetical protein